MKDSRIKLSYEENREEIYHSHQRRVCILANLLNGFRGLFIYLMISGKFEYIVGNVGIC